MGALALTFATAALPAWAQTKIEFFFPVPGRGQARARDDAAGQALQRGPEGGRGHRRLYRRLRRHQAQGAGRRQGRQAAVGGADERQLHVDRDLRRHRFRSTPMLKADETTRDDYSCRFLAGAARQRHGRRRALRVPFQNSTPLLYINVEHFKEAGLDPAKPPAPGPSWSMPRRSSPRGDPATAS